MARLTRALELNPRLASAALLLGQIAFDEGDTELAVRTYERALKAAPGDPDLTDALAALQHDADVHHTFSETRYDRLRVMFEGRSEEALAAQATRVFNSAFFRIGDTLGETHPAPSSPCCTPKNSFVMSRARRSGPAGSMTVASGYPLPERGSRPNSSSG